MPKKRQSTFNTKPNYVHPSLASSRTSNSGASQAGPSTPSVNERLNQLRREQAPKAGIQQRNELAEGLTQKALHPAVRKVLNLPAVAGPRVNAPARLSNGRRLPGPPPPRSWLEGNSQGEELDLNKSSEPASRSGQAPAFWPERLPKSGSLVDTTLKHLARNWDWIVEYEQYYLATLPIPLKGLLLTYIAVHGPASGIGLDTLQVLFKDENELPGATGSDELRHLDLTTFIGDRMSLAELTRFTTRPVPRKDDATVALERLKVSDDVADSWEEAAESGAPQIPQTMNNVRFPCLTHLSLAHPQSGSWAQLLSLSTHLPTLTHLSLAYWPTPTLTPNATTSSISAGHGRVQAGGRHFYSELDNDWQEASNILRRLSQNTYCLRWLDVSGCEWLPALTWGYPDRHERVLNRHQRRGSRSGDDSWELSQGPCGPSWTTSWRQVSYINGSQGWIPRDVDSVRQLPAGLLGCELLGYLRSDEAQKLPESPLKGPESGVQVRKWLEKETEHRKIAQTIRWLRDVGGGPYCTFDHGWTWEPTKPPFTPELEAHWV